jgi:AraC-like DNA-binding protein
MDERLVLILRQGAGSSVETDLDDRALYALAFEGGGGAGDPVQLADHLTFAGPAEDIASSGFGRGARTWFLMDRRAFHAASGHLQVPARDTRRDRKLSLIAEALAHRGESASSTSRPDLLELALIVRTAKVFANATSRPDDAWLPPKALQRLGVLVEAKLSERISLADMSANLGLSNSAFSRAFRGSTGMTPGDYIVWRRLSLAADLLRFSDISTTEVARRVGLGSAQYLSQLFYTRMGLTPLRFRANARGRIREGD